MRALRVSGFEQVVFAPELDEMAQVILSQAQAGDVVLCMGAGSIGQVPQKIHALGLNQQNVSSSSSNGAKV
jgi:UDP-N-acetylmuramate--alanine ligase